MDNNSTGKETCQRCGSPLRTKTCRKCYRADYYAANRKDAIAKSKAYYKETRSRHLKLATEWRDKNLSRHRHAGWKAKLRLRCSSEEYYEKKFVEQSGKCALCGKPPGKIRLAQDHCHKRKVPRGLLCRECNWIVGKYEAMQEQIPAIQAYLKRYEEESICTTLQR